MSANHSISGITDISRFKEYRFPLWVRIFRFIPSAYGFGPKYVTSTGNARALADDGVHTTPPRYSQGLAVPGSTETSHPNMLQPPSPGGDGSRRMSLTPGGTTKVLADLQTGVINARNALENTKAQLRLSQRSVAQLTRQTEDLKEVRERLRLENEGLNNVVARKERLLQEVLSPS